jgi:hypothetical protein
MTVPIRSMPELIEALRNRARELQLTHETIDNVAGLQSGYTSKLLAPKPIKNLGPMSFESILGALGVAVVVVTDQAAIDRVQGRWEKRKRPQKLSASIPLSIDHEVPLKIAITPELQRFCLRPEYMREIGLRGNMKRNAKMSPWKRRVLARRAAKARWGNRETG